MVACLYLRYKYKEDHSKKYAMTARTNPAGYISNFPGNLNDLIEKTSGSGAGLPHLVSKISISRVHKSFDLSFSRSKGQLPEKFTWNIN